MTQFGEQLNYEHSGSYTFPSILGRAKAAQVAIISVIILGILVAALLFLVVPLNEITQKAAPTAEERQKLLLIGGSLLLGSCLNIVALIAAVVL
jgi:hypothetical protein